MVIFSYLDPHKENSYQILCKRFYDGILPKWIFMLYRKATLLIRHSENRHIVNKQWDLEVDFPDNDYLATITGR